MMSETPLISPSSLSSGNVNGQKGVLQLAILAAAASSLDLKLFTDIDTRLRHTLADSVMVTGQKSIELVQAFTLAVTFYAANEPLHKVRVLSLAAQANCMSSDLGLYQISCQFHRAKISTEECYDAMYTALACLWAVNSAMVLFQRPLLPQYPPCTRSYVRILGSSPIILHQQIAAWSELEMTAVESIIFSACNSSRFTEDKASEEDELMSLLDNWKKSSARCLESSKTLLLHYSTVRTRLSEPNLTHSWNDESLKPPFDESVLGGERSAKLRQEAQHVSSHVDIPLIQGALKTALSMSTEDVRAQGIIFFTDICYLFSVLVNDYLFQTLKSVCDSLAMRRAALCNLLNRATTLLDSAAAENSNWLHCNSRTFRNVLIRLRTKLDMTEVAIARQVRDEAKNLEQIIESVYREEQRQSSTVLPPTNPTLGSERVSEQDAMTIDIPFDGPISTILNATDNALAGGTMPLSYPDDFYVFNFEELFQTRE
ncbi:hypothetical protein FALBO_4037 [Fusarium albosuccineum]|uniref:Transcription factor domain-containing protein n=1 Tax=Fusarium albosuccineum TaxID=1237068 RepID=A0A8H4LJ39_9HYPO|nr:hypothetical protein FALBO_4037 [Fusarium albosuccineum]